MAFYVGKHIDILLFTEQYLNVHVSVCVLNLEGVCQDGMQ